MGKDCIVTFFVAILVISLLGAMMKSFMKVILSVAIVFVIYKFCIVGGLNLEEKWHLNKYTKPSSQVSVEQQYKNYSKSKSHKELSPEAKKLTNSVEGIIKDTNSKKLLNELKDTLGVGK